MGELGTASVTYSERCTHCWLCDTRLFDPLHADGRAVGPHLAKTPLAIPMHFGTALASNGGMKVAFTSTDGSRIDTHFGTATSFFIWEIGPKTAECLGKVHAITSARDEEDKIAARAAAIADCAIVYTMQIGGPAAAKLVSHRIHPMKTGTEVPVDEIVEKLQVVLRGSPPPWLRKALGQAPLLRPGIESADDN